MKSIFDTDDLCGKYIIKNGKEKINNIRYLGKWLYKIGWINDLEDKRYSLTCMSDGLTQSCYWSGNIKDPINTRNKIPFTTKEILISYLDKMNARLATHEELKRYMDSQIHRCANPKKGSDFKIIENADIVHNKYIIFKTGEEFLAYDFIKVLGELIEGETIKVTNFKYDKFLKTRNLVKDYMKHTQVVNEEELKFLYDELNKIYYV